MLGHEVRIAQQLEEQIGANGVQTTDDAPILPEQMFFVQPEEYGFQLEHGETKLLRESPCIDRRVRCGRKRGGMEETWIPRLIDPLGKKARDLFLKSRLKLLTLMGHHEYEL
ncbi:hypothetical protein Daqu01_03430 [Deinococcus aquaticus]